MAYQCFSVLFLSAERLASLIICFARASIARLSAGAAWLAAAALFALNGACSYKCHHEWFKSYTQPSSLTFFESTGWPGCTSEIEATAMVCNHPPRRESLCYSPFWFGARFWDELLFCWSITFLDKEVFLTDHRWLMNLRIKSIFHHHSFQFDQLFCTDC